MRLLLGLLLALVAPAQAAILNDGFEAHMPVTEWRSIVYPQDGASSAIVSVPAGSAWAAFIDDTLVAHIFDNGGYIPDFPTNPEGANAIVGIEFRIYARASHPGVRVSVAEMSGHYQQIGGGLLTLNMTVSQWMEGVDFAIGGEGDLAAGSYIDVGGYAALIPTEVVSGTGAAAQTMNDSEYWLTDELEAPGEPLNPYVLTDQTWMIRFRSYDGYNATLYIDAIQIRLHYADSSTAAMTGSGTMTATVQKMVPITAAMSGGGTMAATANAKRVIAANMVGSGKLSPVISRSSGGITYHHFMPELSGSGTMTVAPLSRYAGVSAAMTGGGTMDVLAHRAHGINAGAPVAMTGKGTLAVAVGVLRSITAAMAGSGTFAAAVAARRPVAAAMSGSGTMTAAMIVHRAVQAAMSGSGTLTAVIQRILGSSPVTAAMEGSGTMTASAGVLRAVAAAMVGSGTLDATVQVNTRLPAPEGRRFRVPNDALAFIVPDDFQTFEAQE